MNQGCSLHIRQVTSTDRSTQRHPAGPRRGLQLNSFCKIGWTIQKKLGRGCLAGNTSGVQKPSKTGSEVWKTGWKYESPKTSKDMAKNIQKHPNSDSLFSSKHMSLHGVWSPAVALSQARPPTGHISTSQTRISSMSMLTGRIMEDEGQYPYKICDYILNIHEYEKAHGSRKQPKCCGLNGET